MPRAVLDTRDNSQNFNNDYGSSEINVSSLTLQMMDGNRNDRRKKSYLDVLHLKGGTIYNGFIFGIFISQSKKEGKSAPHLTQDTNEKVTTSHLDIKNESQWSALSQQVTTR